MNGGANALPLLNTALHCRAERGSGASWNDGMHMYDIEIFAPTLSVSINTCRSGMLEEPANQRTVAHTR